MMHADWLKIRVGTQTTLNITKLPPHIIANTADYDTICQTNPPLLIHTCGSISLATACDISHVQLHVTHFLWDNAQPNSGSSSSQQTVGITPKKSLLYRPIINHDK